MSREEPSLDETGLAASLRAAIETAHARCADVAPPRFSPDGGCTVFDNGDRRARVQPLGERTRITLADDDDRMVAEAEVDTAELIERVEGRGATYEALAAALTEENGPGARSC